MKIFFNGSIFFRQKYGGISRYYINLIENFNDNLSYKVFSPIYKNIYLKDSKFNKAGLYLERYPINSAIIKTYTFINNFLLKRYDPDIIHETFYNENIYNSKFKKIITVYDLIHEKYKNFYKNFKNKKKILDQCNLYLCISNNTKNDLINIYNIPENKIRVTPLGGEHILQVKENLNNEFLKKIKSKPYIFYVGSREKYKNFSILLKTFCNSKTINNEFNLICFGGKNFNKDEINFFNHYNVLNKIFYFNGGDDILKTLFKYCHCLISTSLYEGFNIPILEAINMKCPIFLSNTKIHKEVAGDAAFYFDPHDLDSLTSLFIKILFSKNRLFSNFDNYKRIIKKFNWKNCAEITTNSYKELL